MDAQRNESVQALPRSAMQMGLLRMPGVGAVLLRFAIFGLLIAAVAYAWPHKGTVAADALWLAFSIYWALAV